MKILVTGSEGSLMQSVIPRLLEQGHEITGVDNLYRHGQRSLLAGKQYKFVQQDLTDRSRSVALCQNQDAVFLAAAKIYGVGGFNHYCADIISDDTAIQGNVLQGCVKHGVSRVIYISSSMVYETCVQDTHHPVSEDLVNNCVMPRTDYGLVKLLGERMCQSFRTQYGLDYTIWRPFNIITPHESSMAEQGFSHVFADFINNIVVKGLNPLPILGDGEQIRCFTWIDDIANIIAQHSFSPDTLNQAYNICNVEPISMKDLAQRIYSRTGRPEALQFRTSGHYVNDVRVRVPDISKLRSIIGGRPFQDLDTSLDLCLAKYLDV